MNPYLTEDMILDHEKKVNILKPSARYIYDWIMRQNKPFRLVINGEAGSGKSYLF